MKPTINKVLINTNFLVNSITTINQENFLDPENPTHALTTPSKSTVSSFQNVKETNDMVRPFTNSLTGDTALPFKCTELQPITGRQDMDLSRHMSMIYNPTSANTYETHEWPDAP